MAKKIYVIEDDKHIQELLKYNLEQNGYKVRIFDSAEAFLQSSADAPDLVLLDIMLPGMDGLDFCRLLKIEPVYKKVPIIMLTAKGEELDKVLGLELGADDYITKPFGIRELLARVKVVLRRYSDRAENESEVLKAGKILLDSSRREVYVDERLVELTFKEFELLKLLLSNKGKVLSRDQLLEKIWGFDYDGETRTVDVHIRYLRQKLEDDDNDPIYIETVRGIGYRFSDKEDR
ncbi:MAG: response regulator transcription factor [Peptococcaceae bacterium]|jgi:two-component system alkaline phosphatase synthesis response regulator PhoP|nr:response regulator transcription factor [Peptococcaceae bacterium]